MANRVIAFVDGVNLYHAITRHSQVTVQNTRIRPYAKYRWLDLQKLIAQFIGRDDCITEVRYYSAIVPWNADAAYRHRLYIEARATTGVITTLGRFSKKEKRCPLCNRRFETYEEKHTDVNIAIDLISEALCDRYDRAVIISGDNDMLTAYEHVLRLFPEKSLQILLPIDARAENLKKWARAHKVQYSKINENHLRNAQLPDIIKVSNREIIVPARWKE